MLTRYSRQMLLPEIGEAGQMRLAAASVLIVGLGGLGCPVSLYLAGAGVGKLGLVDPDVVSLSNLHRQLLYDSNQVGKPKTEAAANRLTAINPALKVELFPEGLTDDNACELIAAYDLVMDCTDNFATRYLIERSCAMLGKTWVHGSVSGFNGQVSVFAPEVAPYSEIFPDCEGKATGGIIGPTAGIVGSIQAAEAIKLICGVTPTLCGRLLTVNLLTSEFNVFEL